jgi:hypothetical protein
MFILDILREILAMAEMYWEAYAGLLGVAAFIPPLISLLKKFGFIGEGAGANVQAWINTILFLAFIGIRIFLPDFDVGVADSIFKQIASIIVFILGFLGQFKVSEQTYKRVWKGRFGALGYYYS